MGIIMVRKATEIKTCMVLSLMITPDPPLDLPPALSLIFIASLTGGSTSMIVSCRIIIGHQVYMFNKINKQQPKQIFSGIRNATNSLRNTAKALFKRAKSCP